VINPVPPRYRLRCREWMRRIDRAAADLNVILVVLAIGLAVLDLTFVVTRPTLDRLTHAVSVKRFP
jgi:hypothetical protein